MWRKYQDKSLKEYKGFEIGSIRPPREAQSLFDNIKPFAVVAIGYPDGQENKFVDRFHKTGYTLKNIKI